MLDEASLKSLIAAGKIAKEAREYSQRLVKPGVKLLDLAVNIENYIKEWGGGLAFPVNIGVNSVAAHYTPVFNDDLTVPDGSVVKIDIGVHVDGYIADTAITVSLSPAHNRLVEATSSALERALRAISPGMRALEIGRAIEESIKSAGFKPIQNLGGHGIERYSIHSGVVIPNYRDFLCRHRLVPGVYAIEPFATNGVGLVKEVGTVTIYALKSLDREASPLAKTVYNLINQERRGLPFAPRWYINRVLDLVSFNTALAHLDKAGCLKEYPVLVERGGGAVAQFEHTVVVTEREVIVTT
ncbi:MAG: type II methionyl aminopeptidase [Desulfurococcaceae archaeon]